MDSSRLGFDIILRTQAFLITWASIGLRCPPRGPIAVNGHGTVLRAPSANKPSFVKSSSTAHLLEVLVVMAFGVIVIVQLWPAVFCVILAIASQSLK